HLNGRGGVVPGDQGLGLHQVAVGGQRVGGDEVDRERGHEARLLQRAGDQREGGALATDLHHGGLAVGAVVQHLDLGGREDAPEAHHHPQLVDQVAPGLPFGADDIGVDHPSGGILIVVPRTCGLDDELHAVVVDLDVAFAALGAGAAEEGGAVGHDARPDLAGAEPLADVGADP
ncbi:MAG: hypothetical protein ACK559_29840, partial [bacterium]